VPEIHTNSRSAGRDHQALKRTGRNTDFHKDDSLAAPGMPWWQRWVSNGNDHRNSIRSDIAFIFDPNAGCQRHRAIDDLTHFIDNRSWLRNDRVLRNHRLLVDRDYWIARISIIQRTTGTDVKTHPTSVSPATNPDWMLWSTVSKVDSVVAIKISVCKAMAVIQLLMELVDIATAGAESVLWSKVGMHPRIRVPGMTGTAGSMMPDGHDHLRWFRIPMRIRTKGSEEIFNIIRHSVDRVQKNDTDNTHSSQQVSVHGSSP